MGKQCIFVSLALALLWSVGSPAALDPATLLPQDMAFRFKAAVEKPDAVLLSWDIAPGYHLYRDKFRIASYTAGIDPGDAVFPAARTEHDEVFGEVQTYRGHIDVKVPLLRRDKAAETLDLLVVSQGCADAGVCYPPRKENVKLSLPAASAAVDLPAAPAAAGPVPFVAEQDRIAGLLGRGSIWLTTVSFLGFGLVLAFTPCVFPMIPIISGIVVGHGPGITTRRAFLLCLSYVMASALTYTVFGVLAALFGGNLQSLFQEPWLIAAFSGMFALLALSMFGLVSLQVPLFIQARLFALSARQQRGHYWGASVMGVLSALAIGPCVTPPLAGALIYIGQTGNAVLGGLALFALGLGMGIPLLVIGTSAGKLLPRAGAWLGAVKAAFGLGLLGVALWLLGRIAPASVMVVLWSLLAVIPLGYLGWRRLWKGLAALGFTYGMVLLALIATNNRDVAESLLCEAAIACEKPALAFRKVGGLEDIRQALAAAEAQQRPAMLDFYADWCVACKEMEQSTFADPRVQAALSNVVLLQADVSGNSAADLALLANYGLIGPPATLFFGPDRLERKSYRVIGYMEPDRFLSQLGGALLK